MRYVNRARDPGLPGDMQPNVAGEVQFGGWRKSSTTDSQGARPSGKLADDKNKDYRAQIDRGIVDTHNKLNGHAGREPFVQDVNRSHTTGKNGSQAFNGSNLGSSGFGSSRVNGAVTARGTGGNTTRKTGRAPSGSNDRPLANRRSSLPKQAARNGCEPVG